MSTWRRRFSRRSQNLHENNEIRINNSTKYRKKLQATISQINRTKRFVERNMDSSDSPIHIARYVNDIGQLSDCKPLQEITSLIDSLAMRCQLSSRIHNEYAMNSLKQSLERLNNSLSNEFDQVKNVYEESVANHCSDHTQKQLFNKVQIEWSKHQDLAIRELKQGLSSYCDIGLYNMKIQMAILEKLQDFVDQLPTDNNNNTNLGLPNFAANSLQTRKDIDTMLRILLDAAPNNSTTLPNPKRPKFLHNQLTLSNSLYSPEITEAAARSHGQSLRQQHTRFIPQYPSMTYSASTTTAQIPEHESMIITPTTPHNDQFRNMSNDDNLPSYTDLFVVPSSCKESRIQRQSSRFNNQ